MSARGMNRQLAREGNPAAVARRERFDRARRNGWVYARQLGADIGAREFRRRSNECVLMNVPIVIKFASLPAQRIALTGATRLRVKGVLAALETAPGWYELWLVPIAHCAAMPGRPQDGQLHLTTATVRRLGHRMGWWNRPERKVIYTPVTEPNLVPTVARMFESGLE
jgi:hypothetical protein